MSLSAKDTTINPPREGLGRIARIGNVTAVLASTIDHVSGHRRACPGQSRAESLGLGLFPLGALVMSSVVLIAWASTDK